MERSSLNLESEFFSRIIQPGNCWDKYLQRFNEYGLDDIYYDYRYVSLYAKDDTDAQVEAFVYEQNDDVFLLPFIRKPIPDEKGMWDFETAYGYSGPIATTKNRTFLESAWRELTQVAKKTGIIVGLIRFHPLLSTEQFSINSFLKIFYECDTVWLDCKRNINDILSEYPKKNLRRLRSLEKQGVTVRSSQDAEALFEFSKIYIKRMTHLGAGEEYHFGESYFEGIKKLGKDRWKIYLAYTPNNEIMGGCLLLFSKRFCHYHLSASLQEHLKLAPNDILRHAVIKDMTNSSFEAIHFGGGRTSESNDSLLLFKLKFSRQTARFKVGGCIFDEDSYKSICDKWYIKYPEKQNYFGKFLLKYRY